MDITCLTYLYYNYTIRSLQRARRAQIIAKTTVTMSTRLLIMKYLLGTWYQEGTVQPLMDPRGCFFVLLGNTRSLDHFGP